MKLCAVILVFFLLLKTAAEEAGWTYRINEGQATITGCTLSGEVVVPSVLGGVPVTSLVNSSFPAVTRLALPSSVIYVGAFFRAPNLVSITVDPSHPVFSSMDGVLFNKDRTVLNSFPPGRTGEYGIPETTAVVASGSFYGSMLSGVVLPESVREIGASAFSRCMNLAQLSIRPGVITIEGNAFSPSGLVSLTIPDSVVSIGDYAFSSSPELVSVTFPASLSSLGADAFMNCPKLTSITVEPGNASFSSVDGVLLGGAGTMVLKFPEAKSGSFQIPASVRLIGTNAFANCRGLLSVEIPGGVQEIGPGAFAYCTSLLNAPAQEGLQNIANSAFEQCRQLQSFSIPNSVTNLGPEAFKFSGLNQVTIPGSVRSMGHGVFSYCLNLASAAVRSGVPLIGEGAFENCLNLIRVDLPATLLNIGDSAFHNTALSGIAIPASVTNVGRYSFHSTLLTNIVVPDSVRKIGWHAFENCFSLTNATVPAACVVEYKAFANTALQSIFFKGNTPIFDATMFEGVEPTIYFLPGRTGWGTSYAGRPTRLWNPQVSTVDPAFGLRDGRFGFTVIGTPDIPLVIERSEDLANWTIVGVHQLSGGSLAVSEPAPENSGQRVYRLRSP